MASTLSGFVALVAVSALKAITDGAQVVSRTSETAGELRFAARMLQRDLTNLYRDPNPENMRLIGVSQDADTGGSAFLTFYTVARAKARAEQPEGDVYEVEYVVSPRQGQDETAASGAAAAPGLPAQPEGMILLRRVWPNPDREREPRGVLTPVAENISIFQLGFFDGQQWGSEWSEEMRSLPEMIEVTLGIVPPGRREPVLESFLVSFPRLAKGASAATGEGEASAGGQESQAEPERQESGGPSGGGSSGGGQQGGSQSGGGSRNNGSPRKSGAPRDGGGRQGQGGRR